MTTMGALDVPAPTEPTPVVGGGGDGGGDSGPKSEAKGHGKAWLLGIGFVVSLAAVGLGTWWGTSGSSTGPLITTTTESATVGTGNIQQTVSASGTIEPASQADLNFGASGRVNAIDVSVGQVVTAGQALASLDPSALQAQLDEAQASLAAATARQSSDESDDAGAAQLDSDSAAVSSAQSQLSAAQTALSDATLTSTIAGTVAAINVTVGQQVSGSGAAGGGEDDASASGGSGDVEVIATNSYIVTGTVDDTVVGEIADGDQAVITPSGSTTTAYGTVSSVGIIATQSSTVATFPVQINVTGDPSGLYAGSSANVSIIVKQLTDVLEVPTAAISYATGNPTVVLVENGQHITRQITVGTSAAGETQVTSGLKSGDKILETVIHFSGVRGGGAGRTFGGGGVFGGGGGGFGGGGLGGATFTGGGG
jgi:macrolide-specific efflux system membrane fusion protein